MARILIVDDDISLRKMLRLILTRLGHTAWEARDGNAALASLREAPVDLVLTDLIMPEREGLETIEALRRQYPRLGIIAMSGGGRVTAYQYLTIARAMGAHATLEKPFSNDQMVAAIGSVLAAASRTAPRPAPLTSAEIAK
jgi:CheY-like chemotaxis protein